MQNSPSRVPPSADPRSPLAREHAVFETDVGTWDAEIEVRPGPGAEPQRSRGVSVRRLVGGGAWLVTDLTTDGGFEGHGVCGFDQTQSCYVGTWVDSMRRFLVIAAGEWDAEKKRMTYRGEATMPDGRVLRWREETEAVEDGLQVFKSFMLLPDGTEFEMMTVNYRRRA